MITIISRTTKGYCKYDHLNFPDQHTFVIWKQRILLVIMKNGYDKGEERTKAKLGKEQMVHLHNYFMNETAIF